MAPRRLDMPHNVLRALGEGGGGAKAIRYLKRGQRSRALLLIRTAVTLAASKRHPEAPAAAEGYTMLGKIWERTPEVLDHVLCSPLVSAWSLHTVQRLSQGDLAGARPGRLVDIVAPVLQGQQLTAPRICAARGGIEINLLLAVVDHNHFPGIDIDLTAWSDRDRISLWRDRIASGWHLLVRHHRATAAEVGMVMTALAPLMPGPNGHTSGTFRHAFGLVAMSLPPDARSAAATFTHELQHAKLSALMDLFPLVEDRGQAHYYAPWRLDPRPLPALFQGAYAHLGVAGFWRTQRHHETEPAATFHAEVEFIRWRTAAADTAHALLDSGRLTPTGYQFVRAMANRLAQFKDEPVSATASTEAERLLSLHRRQWQAVNGDGLAYMTRSGTGERRTADRKRDRVGSHDHGWIR